MSSGELQYVVYVFSVPVSCMFFCRCVCSRVEPEQERASVQLSGSDRDLTRPLFVHMKPRKHRLPHCGHRQAASSLPVHVFVC